MSADTLPTCNPQQPLFLPTSPMTHILFSADENHSYHHWLSISAPIIPLANVLLVDYLSLDRLTSAVGLMSLAKGVASLFGAPLAGKYLLTNMYFRTSIIRTIWET